MNNLQKFGGIAAIVEAMIYISAFVFFGGFWEYPTNSDDTQKLAYLADNQVILSIVNLTMYVIFGAILTILALALNQRLKENAPVLSKFSYIFGLIWVGLVIASGMIANVGLNAVINISAQNTEQAMTLLTVINTIVEGLGGGNEIVGGVWMLLLSIAALKGNVFSKALNYLGVCIGFVGIITVYPADVLTEVFGLGQIIWFAWLGVAMLKNSQTEQVHN